MKGMESKVLKQEDGGMGREALLVRDLCRFTFEHMTGRFALPPGATKRVWSLTWAVECVEAMGYVDEAAELTRRDWLSSEVRPNSKAAQFFLDKHEPPQEG